MRVCVCVCVCWRLGGGGDADVYSGTRVSVNVRASMRVSVCFCVPTYTRAGAYIYFVTDGNADDSPTTPFPQAGQHLHVTRHSRTCVCVCV